METLLRAAFTRVVTEREIFLRDGKDGTESERRASPLFQVSLLFCRNVLKGGNFLGVRVNDLVNVRDSGFFFGGRWYGG